MAKATEQNDKLKRAITISVVLHIILIALLIWGSFDEYIDVSAGGGGGSAVDAVMVDPGAVIQNYNRQQQLQANARRAEEQREKQAAQQAQELREKQAAEQQRLKQLEKERLQAQEAAKKAQEQQKQAEEAASKAAAEAKAKAEAQAKAAEEAAAKAVADARKKAEEEAAKAAAEVAKKAQQEAEKKAQQEAEKKAQQKAAAEKAAAAKAAAEKAAAADVDDLFGDLSSGKNAPKTGGGAKGNSAAPAGSGNAKNNGASGADISNYAGQIKAAIESRFYDASSWAGKTCTLRIRLAPDGMLLDIKSEGGDPALCNAALAAARQAKIPKPPSPAVYEVFKNAPLDFRP